MSVTVNDGVLKKWTHDGEKVKKWIHNDVKVWSGASVVSYYDGANLIGIEEVDEGLDVLHPTIDVSKDNYTLVGWKYNSDSVTELVATGEPMTINAVYAPNILVVYKANDATDSYWANISEAIRNSDYISGTPICGAGGYNTWGGGDEQPKEGSTSFSIKSLGVYKNATVVIKTYRGATSGSTTFRYNGSNTSGGTYNYTGPVSASLYAHTYAAYGSWASVSIYASSITLSNPKGWV